MKINYNNRKFRPVSNSNNGEVSADMVFHYDQTDNILACTYSGASIKKGQLIGLVNDIGEIEMKYHQVNIDDKLMTGICHSKPEIMENGKIRLHETWQWTSGDQSKGNSVLEEI